MRSYRIGSAFGIPIKLDLTFLLVLPLFAYVIGSSVGQWVTILNGTIGTAIEAGPLTGDPVVAYGIGLLAAVGLFVGVVLHELGHSLVAMRYGFPIASITLWLFGGVAQLSEVPDDWKQELYIALAGPTVSVLLGLGSYAALRATDVVGTGSAVLVGLRFLLGYLAVMNVTLAVFNMLPGFPMDGGRVLRALLARSRPYARATQIAAEVGKGFAILLGLFGLLGPGGINLFMVAIAFFIYIGASSEAQQTIMKAAFEGVTVRDLMTTEVDTVATDASVADLVDRMFRERHTGYPVVENGEVVGMVTLSDAQSVKEVERDAYEVEEIMSRDLHTVGPDDSAMDAISTMQREGVGRLLVMEDGSLAGILSRTDIMTALNVIQESGRIDPREETEPRQPRAPN